MTYKTAITRFRTENGWHAIDWGKEKKLEIKKIVKDFQKKDKRDKKFTISIGNIFWYVKK